MIKLPVLMLSAQLVASSAAAAPPPANDAARAVMNIYLAAWDRADASALGSQYSADSDFIGPDGTLAVGPAQVEAFYSAAFKRGYAGSRASFKLIKARLLRPGILAVDGEWEIAGARKPDGSARAPENGIATAILLDEHGAWRIGLLREQESARAIQPLTPSAR